MDYILDAIKDHILDNSTHDVDDWVEVFPDIFGMTEYIITPMWNRYSIPNMTLQTGLYSPMVNFNQDIDDILPTFTLSKHMLDCMLCLVRLLINLLYPSIPLDRI